MPSPRKNKTKFCPKKRETDSLGGVKIQFHGKPNEYGYQHIKSLQAMPKELEPIFEQQEEENETTTRSSSSKFLNPNENLWSQFWTDVLSAHENCTPTSFLLHLGFVSSLVAACLAYFKIESTSLMIGCIIVMFGFFHLIMKSQVAQDVDDDKKNNDEATSSSQDNYILQVNKLLENKYNIPYFRPKKWVARCHAETGVSSINQRPQTYYIIHFTPIRKTRIKFDT